MTEPNNELFGGVFYINLDHRTDRREQMEGELNKLGLKYERFPAIRHVHGNVGCGLSHLAVLKIAKARGLKNVLIFEDDFELIVEPKVFWQEMNKFFDSGIEFDMLLPSYIMYKSAPFNDIVRKVLNSQTTSSYVINNHYYDTLIHLWEYGISNLENTQHSNYCIDMMWKSLQPEGKWYAFIVRLGKQRASFSDIDNGYRDYSSAELKDHY